jgi:(1->4)-alpha-D-glucan 1-alpha-D-glucosylmutase
MNELIERLAELAGIQPFYQDIWGHTHLASLETKQALLTAMGVACGDEAAARESLRQWELGTWQRLLPAVSVHTVGESPLRVTLRLPARDLGRTARWRLSLEQGEVIEGVFRPDALARLERAELDDGEYLALALELPPPCCVTPGYHHLELGLDGMAGAETTLIVCPPACYQPPAVADGRRVWGVGVQLYGVRSARNWGMGDFTDLARLVDWAAGAGAALVGVNPLHALYPHNPRHCSPYSPSSRQFLNLLYIDVEAVPDYAECEDARAAVADPAFQARLAALRAAPLVDYAGVAQAKSAILERLHAHFRSRHLAADSDRARAFRAYCAEQGEDLYLQALYEALQAHLHDEDPACWGWPVWPEAFRSPHNPAVRQWAADHRDRVEYHLYLHWLAATQLAAAAERARQGGLEVGLYQDLAVGVDRGGAETWMHRDLYAFAASVGAPPDDFNLHGQDWGLPPLIPHRLIDAAYCPFIRMLRANMRTAGALRIDHVMGLMRLYWVPPGQRADQGVYVSYPLHDLMGILALESQRNRCLVIGEDLGTVPDAMRQAMRERGILAYRLFYFEKHWQGDHGFKSPWEIDRDALVAATTHDLPTLAGFWRGSDITWRSQLQLFPSDEQRQAQIVGRAEDRARLLLALEREGLLPAGMTADPAGVPEMTPALALAIQRYLARSPARLLLVQAEDMLGETEQANLPGTVSGHPNWQRKLSLDLEDWAADARLAETARALAAERG